MAPMNAKLQDSRTSGEVMVSDRFYTVMWVMLAVVALVTTVVLLSLQQ